MEWWQWAILLIGAGYLEIRFNLFSNASAERALRMQTDLDDALKRIARLEDSR